MACPQALAGSITVPTFRLGCRSRMPTTLRLSGGKQQSQTLTATCPLLIPKSRCFSGRRKLLQRLQPQVCSFFNGHLLRISCPQFNLMWCEKHINPLIVA